MDILANVAIDFTQTYDIYARGTTFPRHHGEAHEIPLRPDHFHAAQSGSGAATAKHGQPDHAHQPTVAL